MGTVTTALTPLWHLDPWQRAAIDSAALWAAVAGCLTFGPLMDWFGRRTMYGVEALLLTLGAVLSALAAGPQMLVAARSLMGLGVVATIEPVR